MNNLRASPQATCSGVFPFEFLAVIEAPWSISMFTSLSFSGTESDPLSEAKCRGVFPSESNVLHH